MSFIESEEEFPFSFFFFLACVFVLIFLFVNPLFFPFLEIYKFSNSKKTFVLLCWLMMTGFHANMHPSICQI